MNHDPNLQSAAISNMDTKASRDHVKHLLSPDKDENGTALTVQRKCSMSLDISEYELQMLEMQARQEEKEEQSIVAFQVCLFSILLKNMACFVQLNGSALFFFHLTQERSALESSGELSFELESDEELDSEMIEVKLCFCVHILP